MFLEQQISILEWFLKDYVTLKLLFVNNNIFINVSNDECCVPKCKLKRLERSAAQLALAVNRSLSLRRHAHGPLAERLMHMAHKSGNTSGVLKSSSDWLNYTGFPGDVCVAFFNVPPGNKNAVTPNPLTKEESRRVSNWRRALIRSTKRIKSMWNI